MSTNGEEDDYFIKWEKHYYALVSYFGSLFRKSTLVDCTLSAEDKHIKVHRMVLMACSPYFEELLSDHYENSPIVFLDIKFSELKAIVDFCYQGEVKLSSNEMDDFLKAANVFQIRGLFDKSRSSDKAVDCTSKLKRTHFDVHGNDHVSPIDSVSVSEVDSECRASELNENVCAKKRKMFTSDLMQSFVNFELPTSEEKTGSDNSDVDTDDDSESSLHEDDVYVTELFMQASGSLLFPWSCNKCNEAFKTRKQYQDHRKNCSEVPIDHPWKCEQCPNTYKNKKDLIRHLNYCGKEQPRLVCDKCNNTYKYYRGLKRHKQYCGTDVKPLKCPDCSKTYKYKRGLRRHQRRCAVFRAIQFLQERGVHPVNTDPKLEKEKRITSTSDLVCGCGKAYKYERSFHRHQSVCFGSNSESSLATMELQSKICKDLN